MIKIFKDKQELIKTSEFPYATYPFEFFNPVQSRVIDFADSRDNLLIASQTSSGKTISAELLISQEIRANNKKALYLAPLRSLAQEKLDDWLNPSWHFNDLNVCICTGDYRFTSARISEIEESHIITMTSEMLNSCARNHTSEKNQFLKDIGTIVADEVHILGSPSRGHHIENGIIKILEVNPNVRLCLLSATLPNVEEVGEWISKLTGKTTNIIRSDYRPCPLQMHFPIYQSKQGYDDNENQKINKAIQIIQKHPDKFLAFVHAKRTGHELLTRLQKLQIPCAFHSADVSKDKRLEIENNFRTKSEPRVLVSTSTLAWGCYKFGSKVVMEDGNSKSIESIEVGEKVLSFNGKDFSPETVVRIGTKDFDKSLVIKLSTGEEVEVSYDHLFYAAIKRDSPDWVEAQQLRVGDYLAVPTGFNIPTDLMFCRKSYLFGYAAGDGCLVRQGNHADGADKLVVDIAFGSHELKHALWIQKLLTEETGYPVSDLRKHKDGTLHLVCKARSVSGIFVNKMPIGKKGDSWEIPSMNRNDTINYIRGLFDTDGGVESHGNGNWSVGLSSISEKVIRQVNHFLLTLNIRSSVGKKKMEDTIIRGRFQKAQREYCWRLRIYHNCLTTFRDKVGFHNEIKTDYLNEVINKRSTKKGIDRIPARRLVVDHISNLQEIPHRFRLKTGVDLWKTVHKQDLERTTVARILENYPCNSKLNDLYNSDLSWVKIVKITPSIGGKFQDIEIENNHNYVGGGILSHNCNLPSRRVIILGVHRGKTEVDNFDILQMCGRAGRPKYDKEGDAYILVPDLHYLKYKESILTPVPITSQLIGSQTLAFHLVSEIHHDRITNLQEVDYWYKKTLAFHQKGHAGLQDCHEALRRLEQAGCIKVDGETLAITPVGAVSSMFYYDPFDCSALAKNFSKLFSSPHSNKPEYMIFALSCVPSNKNEKPTVAEVDELGDFSSLKPMRESRSFFSGQGHLSGEVKTAFCYHNLMNDSVRGGALGMLATTLKMDFDRLSEMLGTLNSVACGWNRSDFFNELRARITYGVGKDLLPLVNLPGIGKMKSKKLFAFGLKTLQDVANKPLEIVKALGCKPEMAQKLALEASQMLEKNNSPR